MYNINPVPTNAKDTESQARLRKNTRETFESETDASAVLGYALGAASTC